MISEQAMVFRGYILIIIGVTQIASSIQNPCSIDPCTVNSLLTLSNIEGRSLVCSGGGGSGCDAFISAGWYKVNVPMSDKCPGLNNCGTLFPVWLNGSEPSEVDGVVERSICQVGPLDCCAIPRSILIKKCSNFTAYCLQPLSSCPVGYCFGQNESCDNGANTEVETNRPTTDTTTDRTKITAAVKGPITLNTSSWLERLYEKDRIISILGVLLGIAMVVILVMVIVCVFKHRQKSGTKGERRQSCENVAYDGIVSNPTNPYNNLNEGNTSVYTQVRNLGVGNGLQVNNGGTSNQETVHTTATEENSSISTEQHYVNVQKGTTQEQTEKENTYEKLNEQTYVKDISYRSLSETEQTVPKTVD